MIIALASPAVAASCDEALEKVKSLTAAAAAQGARIVCFPEAYIPGLRGQDFEVPPFDAADQARAVRAASDCAARLEDRHHPWPRARHPRRPADRGLRHRRERPGDRAIRPRTSSTRPRTRTTSRAPAAASSRWTASGSASRSATRDGAIRRPCGGPRCGARRWSSIRSTPAAIPSGVVPKQWGAPDSPYYEKAMMMRSIENGIYFASVNYALRYPESATSVIDPSGRCQALPAVRAGGRAGAGDRPGAGQRDAGHAIRSGALRGAGRGLGPLDGYAPCLRRQAAIRPRRR